MQKTRAAFTSLSLFSWGGCEPHPLHMAPGWGTAPTRPTRSGGRTAAGRWVGAKGSHPRHMQPVNATLKPVPKAVHPPGSGEIRAWHSPSPSLHACGSRAETTQLISAVVENRRPHPVPDLSLQCPVPIPSCCSHLRRGPGSSPGKIPRQTHHIYGQQCPSMGVHLPPTQHWRNVGYGGPMRNPK